MDISIVLAKIIGSYFVIVAALIVFFPSSIHALINTIRDKGVAASMSLFTVIFGIIIVSLHNIWSLDWHGLITIIGWLTLVKGVVLFAKPELLLKQAVRMEGGSYYIHALIAFVIGAYLLYQSGALA